MSIVPERRRQRTAAELLQDAIDYNRRSLDNLEQAIRDKEEELEEMRATGRILVAENIAYGAALDALGKDRV